MIRRVVYILIYITMFLALTYILGYTSKLFGYLTLSQELIPQINVDLYESKDFYWNTVIPQFETKINLLNDDIAFATIMIRRLTIILIIALVLQIVLKQYGSKTK